MKRDNPGSGVSCIIVLVSILILSLMAGTDVCPAAESGPAAADRHPQSHNFDYIIGLGDVIEVQVWKEPDLTKTMPVRIDGRISLPLIGDVEAAGKSTSELALYLEQSLAKVVKDPSVSVMLVENRSRKYYVLGQINQPGEFPIDYPVTLLQAIARSGGFMEWAKTSKISVVRRESGRDKILSFDYDSFLDGGNLRQNVLIAPGDTIIVP